ncbi:Nitroreductase family protein [Desulfosarcina cetonica]|uniref:nitroreductase family protein n=1 Tax=Desulfosarcina cetonica TaxID=90730 RepID=UPI0006D13A51|nr:nitroreductase family protein [Desulfosarcina cetonica]VTR63874.1 Nitroreductase family protein [Desulfosarcina cetonica]
MTDLMTLIKSRRSVRKYEDRQLPDDLLSQVLEAFGWAPSWANSQCWEVIVVRDPAVRAQIQASLPAKGNPAFKAVVEASVLLVVCAKSGVSGYYKGQCSTKLGDWMMYDLGLATQNLCLMAHHLGLGTVIVGLFDHDRAKAAVDVPEGYELVSLIPLGYPAKTGGAPQRRDVNAFTHTNRF